MKTKKTSLTPKKIINTLQQNSNEIRNLSVKKLGLFGSYLKKSHHKKSDLDFIVVFRDTTFDNYIELKFLLEKLFHKKIDLVIEESLKPSLNYIKGEAMYAKRI